MPFGWWLSRYSAKMMTTITLAAGTFFVFVQGWAPTFAVLLLGRLLFGLAGTARDPARAMLVQQWLPRREMILFNGILPTTFGVVQTASFVATPFLLKAFDGDWRNTFYVLGFLNVGMTLAWVLLGRENITQAYKRRIASQEGTPLQSLFRHREPWLVGIGMAGFAAAFQSQNTFWPTFMKDTYGTGLVASGFLMGIGGLVVVAGGFLVMPLLSKTGGNRLPLVVIGICMTGTFLGVLVTDVIPVLLPLFIVSSVARGALFTVFNTIPFELPGSSPREIAVTQSLMMTLLWIGGFLGPILVGFIQEATGDLGLGMIVSGSCPIILSLTALLLPGREKVQPIGARG